MVKVKRWHGNTDKCDICNKSLKNEKHFINGRTVQGFWCLMCRDCHSCFGTGIGMGRGQIYSTKDNVKVAG